MRDLNDILNRHSSTHKGENGKVGVLAGSKDYSGAPSLSAKAALRTGSDLVKIMTSEEVSDVVRGYSENFIVREYKGKYFSENDVEKAVKVAEWCDAMVIGPGLAESSLEAISKLGRSIDTNLVVDARAIKPLIDEEVKAVFTPHQKEAEYIKQEFGSIKKFVSDKENSIVLLKGERDEIYTEEGILNVDGGNAGMTVGGTGDVLTGITAGLLSQGATLKEASFYSAKINSRSGERAFQKYGNGLLATDIIDEITESILSQN